MSWFVGIMCSVCFLIGYIIGFSIHKDCRNKFEIERIGLSQHINVLKSQLRAIGNCADNFQREINSDVSDLVKHIHERVDKLTK